MPHDETTHDHELTSALERLRDAGQRITGPRRSILRMLIEEHGPFGAEEVHRRLPDGECDLVTVYRTLTSMEELGLVRRCDFGDGTYRYEFNHAGHHHHHVICRSCRKVRVIDVCVVDALERIARQMGYTDVTHTLELFGVCPECQRLAAKAG